MSEYNGLFSGLMVQFQNHGKVLEEGTFLTVYVYPSLR
jgi:hypothetical protein